MDWAYEVGDRVSLKSTPSAVGRVQDRMVGPITGGAQYTVVFPGKRTYLVQEPLLLSARVAELADARDLKSPDQ